MSNAYAIAATTAALRYLVTPALRIVPGAQVATVRPDHLGKENLTRGVNIYLYRVSPNPDFRNLDLPTRDASGVLQQTPVVALDLNYILTFFGDDSQLEPQRLLGATVSALHENPFLTPELIRAAAASASDLGVARQDLSEQEPRVQIYPKALTLHDLHQIWSTFYQVPYSLSIAYEASVVLIEGTRTERLVGTVDEVHVHAETEVTP